jgi:hypothetical protein
LNKAVVRGWLIAALTVIMGCGGGTPATPVAPSPPPPPPAPGPPPLTATVVIGSNNAFVPAEVTVGVGGRVTFVNQNNRPHDITSDPLHLHTDCPAIIQVGFIQPGQTKQTGVLEVARVCGFHDHMQENNTDLHGRIIVQ